jgi:hypothetical protein
VNEKLKRLGVRVAALVVLGGLIGLLFAVFGWWAPPELKRRTPDPRLLGTVESTGVVPVAGVHGGSRQRVGVRLDDGRLLYVLAAKRQAQLVAGERVELVPEVSSPGSARWEAMRELPAD